MQLAGPLVLVGAGNMGGALLKGWLDRGLAASDVLVQDPVPPAPMVELMSARGIAWSAALEAVDRTPSVILLAVKPQIMDDVVPSVVGLCRPETVVLSVAAGRTIRSLAQHFPANTAIVRTIPNTPASVGRGITVAVANPAVTDSQRRLCQELLEAVGSVGWVDDERLIDAATAVSGSGPAYVFLLAECLEGAALAAGLPADLARRLARETVSGAGELLRQSDRDAATLRENVTSPKGTTAAALEVLMGPGAMPELMARAVKAAKDRAEELAK
ncbi:MAG: pyrroline-5-carboxylate reductase [Hyphomicrobiaceae bacterium]